MFTLLASRRGSRRDFVRVGTLGIGSLLLPDALRARAQTSSSLRPSVVWLWLAGGPSQIETFDPKPDAPAEIRSTVGIARTKTPGVFFGGPFEQLAARSDKLAVVRSFTHTNSGHGGGTHWVMTGYDSASADNGGEPERPGVGAILSHQRGATTSDGLPTYVRTRDILGDGPAWLGRGFAPFDVGGKARENMASRQSADTMSERRRLLNAFDGDRNDPFEAQAFDLIQGKAKRAFDLDKEDPRLRDRYGPGLGERMLLARRLCESGVGFVTVHYGGWDHHGSIARGFNQQGPVVDRAVSAFIDDVADRGLDEDILLVVTGEFGRTPKLNTAAGRDHWAPLSTLMLSGGGLKMGQVIGESTPRAETPKSRPVTPQDLMATLFKHLDIPADHQATTPGGRPTPMLATGKAIDELW